MIEDIIKIERTCDIMRQSGSTTWLIESAIVNPYCILVFKDERSKNQAEQLFVNLITNNSVFRELHRLNDGDSPIFTTIQDMDIDIRGHRKALIFDNSCF